MWGDVQGFQNQEIKELFETGELIEVLQMVGPHVDGTPTSITIKKTSRTGTSIVLQKRCEFHLVLMTLWVYRWAATRMWDAACSARYMCLRERVNSQRQEVCINVVVIR